jgi:hypothetical protein
MSQMVGASYRCRGISGATLGVRDCRRGVSVPARSHTVAVAHNEHPQHELRIDRRSPDIAVERRQVLAQLGTRDTTGLIRRSRWLAGISASRLNR